MTYEEADKILGEAVARVGEHFDAVLLIGSWTDGADTCQTWAKGGNWYACIGMAHEFLEGSSHEMLAEKLADAIVEKEGQSEDGDEAA